MPNYVSRLVRRAAPSVPRPAPGPIEDPFEQQAPDVVQDASLTPVAAAKPRSEAVGKPAQTAPVMIAAQTPLARPAAAETSAPLPQLIQQIAKSEPAANVEKPAVTLPPESNPSVAAPHKTPAEVEHQQRPPERPAPTGPEPTAPMIDPLRGLQRKADAFMASLLARTAPAAPPSPPPPEVRRDEPPSEIATEPDSAELRPLTERFTPPSPPAPVQIATPVDREPSQLVIGQITVEVTPTPSARPLSPRLTVIERGGGRSSPTRRSRHRFGFGQV